MSADERIVVDGKPNKVFEVFSVSGWETAKKILKKLGVTDYALFYGQGFKQYELLEYTASVLKKYPDCEVYAEDMAAFVNGRFPSTFKLDKEAWKKFVEEIEGGKERGNGSPPF